MKITGKKLIEMGYRPGKWFKEALEHVNHHGLSGEALTKYLDSVAPETIDPHDPPLDFHQNISAETPEDYANIEAVFATMRELMKTPTLVAGAVMPDACPAGGFGQIPVGGIAVAKNAIHPAMHSADVCCSLMMTRLGDVSPKKALDAALTVTHFGGGGRKDFFELPESLREKIRGNAFLKSDKSRFLAKAHLGTQGDGNHFLFVGQSQSNGETVIVTHHGSRGFGALLYKQGMKAAEIFRKEISPKTRSQNAWIPYDSEEGKAYWEALQIVREWTKLNHSVLHEAACRRLGIDPLQRFWNEHNFVFKEDELFYHAKGATPLDGKFLPDAESDLRIIPLNMSEPVLIVEGLTTEINLGFAPHGAGRNISRSQHKRNKADRSIDAIFAKETAGLDVRFYSGNIDISELPSAYKDAGSVKKQMAEFGLGETVDEILPYGCIMAGDWQKDAPWRRKKRRRR